MLQKRRKSAKERSKRKRPALHLCQTRSASVQKPFHACQILNIAHLESVFDLQCQVGGSPSYIVEKKLGKGGFGQVFVGKRATPSTSKEASASQYVSAMS